MCKPLRRNYYATGPSKLTPCRGKIYQRIKMIDRTQHLRVLSYYKVHIATGTQLMHFPFQAYSLADSHRNQDSAGLHGQISVPNWLSDHQCQICLEFCEYGRLRRHWSAPGAAASDYIRPIGDCIWPIIDRPGLYNSCGSGKCLWTWFRPVPINIQIAPSQQPGIICPQSQAQFPQLTGRKLEKQTLQKTTSPLWRLLLKPLKWEGVPVGLVRRCAFCRRFKDGGTDGHLELDSLKTFHYPSLDTVFALFPCRKVWQKPWID